MGWWDCGVVDGDGPWDIIDCIEAESGILALTVDDEGNDIDVSKLDMLDREDLFKKQRDLFKAIPLSTMLEQAKECSHDGDDVAIQTVAFLFLKWQVTMPDDFKQQVLESIARDNSSEWIDAEERRTQMAIFKRAVETQDGDGLRYCGLFWSAVMDKRQYFD